MKSLFFLLPVALFMVLTTSTYGQDYHSNNSPTTEDSLDTIERKTAEAQLNKDRADDAKAINREYKAKAKEAQRIEKEANYASKQARKAEKMEKRAQRARKDAEKQSRKATKAAKKSDRN